jgi:hypothetical protein
MQRVREGLRLASRLLESDVYKEVAYYRIYPTDAMLADDDALDRWIRQTMGTAGYVSGTRKVVPDSDPWWSWINTAESRASKGCGW